MKNELQRIAEATSWRDYYAGFKAAYTLLLQNRWALGKAGFAGQLHHTVVPDVAGQAASVINWAVYSQPSLETLESFLTVFSELLDREPHRLRNNRYLFFVKNGASLTRDRAQKILGKKAALLDFWCGSLEQIGNVGFEESILQGFEALFSVRPWSAVTDQFSKSPQERLRAVTEDAKRDMRAGSSVAPNVLREPLIGSSVVLFGASTKMASDALMSILGPEAGIAACLAYERAKESGLADFVEYCKGILERCQPSFVEYRVKPGDTLSHITRHHYHVSYTTVWPLVRAINPEITNPNFLRAGRILKLPALKQEEAQS